MDEPPPLSKPIEYGVARAVFYLLALGIVAWPFLSFVAIFVFDAPIRDAFDEAKRYAIVLSVWGYPAFWGLGWMLLKANFKRGARGLRLIWPLGIALLPLVILAADLGLGV